MSQPGWVQPRSVAWLRDAPNTSPLDQYKVEAMAGQMPYSKFPAGTEMVFVQGKLTNGRHRCAALLTCYVWSPLHPLRPGRRGGAETTVTWWSCQVARP